MVSQCVSAVCMLGIVMLGMLVMTRAIRFDQAMSVAGRALLFVIGALLAICIVKELLVSAVIPWLSSLEAMLWWVVLIALAVISLILITRKVISKLQK